MIVYVYFTLLSCVSLIHTLEKNQAADQYRLWYALHQ